MSDLTGQQLSNYRLTQRLGSGAFGDVYQGENIFLGNLVAIKLLHTRLDGENARKFLFEAQTLVRLSHQHIIRVIDFRIERGRPMLIMDYVQGGSLRQKHKRGSLLPLELVVYYVKQIAEALQFAHNQRIIHQDVKPENVLIGAEQHLYLSDFGLAVTTSSTGGLAIQPEGAGTPQYMAPEQWQKHPTVFSDQYSLAIMAYEWLCGKRPFEGSGIAFQHVFEQPQPLRELCPELPEAVEQVVLRGLAKVPEQRFVSVRAFALALEQASLEEITEVPPKIKPGGQTPPHAPDENKTPVQRKLFIAAASADKVFAEKVTADLQKRDIKFTYDPRAHLKQEEVLREAIRASSLVMIVASPQMRTSQTIREQLRIALLYKRQLVFVWARGENIAASLLDLAGKTEPIDVIDARNGRYETALDEIVDCLQEDPSLTPVAVTPPISLNDEPRNPYKGLRPFSREDASDFFGRDTLVQQILERLEKMLNPQRPVKYQQRLLTVVGPSGSGKSSVVMAGVLPKLQRGAITGSEKWCYVETMVPGQHPCDRLLSILEKQFPQKTPAEVRAILAAENGYGLYQLASTLSSLTNRRVVLCVDQFEELFAVGVPEAERQHFLKVLMAAMTEPESPLVVILTLRADFYDRPMHHRQLAALITANQVSVLPMDNDELRAAIERPATQEDVQLFFEGDLVGDLLFELHGQEGALPLLEFTLEQLFQQRQGHLLTYGAYQAIGGLRGALARHADDVYDGLPSDEHRKLVQTLFLRLVDPGKSEQDTTRRRMVVSELLFEDEQQTRLMNEVAHSFISARLLTTTMMAGVTSVEVSHEALIREWPRLAIWLRDAREDIVLQHTITNDAAIWQKTGQAADRLYRGLELGEAVRWLGRNKGNVDEVAFVRAGEAEEERRKMLEEERLKEKLRLEKRAVQRLRGFVVALSLFLIVSIISALFLFKDNQSLLNDNNAINLQANTIQKNAIAENSNFALAQNKVDIALLLGVEATNKLPNGKTSYDGRNSLLNSLNANKKLIKYFTKKLSSSAEVAFTPNGQTLLVTDNNAVYKWNTVTGQGVSLPLKNMVTQNGNAAFSPDGHYLLGVFDSGIWLWDMQTGDLIQSLLGPMLTVPPPSTVEIHTTASYSSDGKFAVMGRCSLFHMDIDPNKSTCNQTEISVWDMSKKQPIGPSLSVTEDITSIAVSTDARVAMVSQKGIQFWDAAANQRLSPYLNTSNTITSVAFSPDGAVLASGDATGTVKLWSVATLQNTLTMPTMHTALIRCLSFSPDGNKLASGSSDKTVEVWDAKKGLALWNLAGDGEEKTSVAFASDNIHLATGSANGQAMLWDISADSPISRTISKLDGWRDLQLDPTGKTVFSATDNNQVVQQTLDGKVSPHIFDMSDLPALNPLNFDVSGQGVIQSLTISHDGSTLAAGRLDGEIAVWNIKTHLRLAHFEHPEQLSQILLSADGKTLIASGLQGHIKIWDVTQKTPVRTIQTAYNELSIPIAFDSDKKLLAIPDCAGKPGDNCTQKEVRIIQLDTLQTVAKLIPNKELSIWSIAFGPNHQTLAMGVDDGVVLWDTHTWQQQGQTIITNAAAYASTTSVSGYTNNLQFSRNGQFLVSYTDPNNISFSFVVWDVTNQEAFLDVVSDDTSTQGSITFDPDGQALLLVANRNGGNTLVNWSLRITDWQKSACKIANRNLNQQEWDQFVRFGKRDQTCMNFP